MMINWVRVDEANRLRHDKLPRKLIKQAQWHGLLMEALKQFAKRRRGYWRGILSRVRLPMHTGQLEGINNRIKVKKGGADQAPISRKAHNKHS